MQYKRRPEYLFSSGFLWSLLFPRFSFRTSLPKCYCYTSYIHAFFADDDPILFFNKNTDDIILFVFFFFFGFPKVGVHNVLRTNTERNTEEEEGGGKNVVKTTLVYDFIAIKRRRVEGTTGVPCQDRRSRVILGLLTTKRLYSFPILVCDTARGK